MFNIKKIIAVVLFLLIGIASILFSYLLRFEFSIPHDFFIELIKHIPLILAIKLLVFWFLNFFRGWWRYVSIYDALNIITSSLISTLLIILYMFFAYDFYKMPRSAFIIDFILFTMAIFILRVSPRLFKENYSKILGKNSYKKRVLIVGAGSAGQMIAREIRGNERLNAEVVGFVDDDPTKLKLKILGLRVIGSSEDIPIIVKDDEIQEIIIAIPSATGKDIKRISEICRKSGAKYKIIPGFGDLIGGKVSISSVREVEIDDLLGRNPINLNLSQISEYIAGKTILITGAGGSIGSEICRQILKYNPYAVIILDIAETPLFFIENQLRETKSDQKIYTYIADIKNYSRIDYIFEKHRPEVVIHAAAYKHVPMMELHPYEAIQNNIYGTKVVSDLSTIYGVKKFILISTDKAVNPTNIMGATKRIAELYIQSITGKSETKFIIVRFGNVLGSNGSVIPIFREQLKKGGPLTVTHPEVTRYFMTIPEAVQLVLQAGGMGNGGELFLLDMGEPVKIVKLAEEMIRLSNLEPYSDIDIIFTGLRPGEKLYEELLLDEEGASKTEHEKIWIAKQGIPDADTVFEVIDELLKIPCDTDTSEVKKIMKKVVKTLK
ncbi:MAG: polysaccharide biosynthesis protein [Calditerrivibrio sp.]|nr:polysaccharide biosynthesis protein [Calditerrivibrio sp.]MCA1981031.1 polysaccharide biosynthesis protein [Calditerrivibrio sp.]